MLRSHAQALGFQLAQDLSALEPFGAGNPRPVFATRGFRVLSEPQIIKEQHLKLRVAGDDNRPIEAIWWRGMEEVEQTPKANERIDLAYELEANRWQGDIRLQLNVKDMKVLQVDCLAMAVVRGSFTELSCGSKSSPGEYASLKRLERRGYAGSNSKKRISAVDLRARVPAIARGLALLLLIGGAIFVGVSYYKMRNNTPFRLKSEAPALSKEITGIINGYERRITKNDRLYLWLRAARDVSYADGHHELETGQPPGLSADG